MRNYHFQQQEDADDRSIERKIRADEAAWDRWCKKADKAEAMIGELCREGRTVHYVYPVGGRYREGTRQELVDFLIRNRYVH